MKPNISEFSYGYALTENLIGLTGPVTIAPVFPSLIQEGQSGGGYDVKLQFGAIPLFLQFKLSEYMKSRRAVEFKKYNLFAPPYYRMNLRPLKHSQQHNLLLALEAEGNLVYYVAPTFHEVAEINQYYSKQEIVERSIFIRPSKIGTLPDDNPHHVAFKLISQALPLQVEAYLLSEPAHLEVQLGQNVIEIMISHLSQHHISDISAQDMLVRLYEQMSRILQAQPNRIFREQIGRLHFDIPLVGAAYLARMYFGCELFLASFRQPDLVAPV